jgi:ribosomal protein S18 acetylase RimI-like enzyme
VIRFRTFRNGDPPALADLWNRGLPECAVAHGLSPHQFDALVMDKLGFDAAGLIVAEDEGRIVGFSHAGFGPEQPAGPSHRLDTTMGTIAMLVVEPGRDDPELEHSLLAAAERYLRDRGARVIYAGGQDPLNPFYWGLYGGSEWAGILSGHAVFHRALARAEFSPVATTVLLEADPRDPEFRGPRAPFIRRQTRLEILDDAPLDRWWDTLAIGFFRPTRFQLLHKDDDRELARAVTWEMEPYSRAGARTQVGLIAIEVNAAHRRQGYGRYLLVEVLRHAREHAVESVAVQTSATNAPALALYQALGFVPVETATLYRKAGS